MAGYVFQYLPCYTVGPDAYDRIPEVCGRFGKKAVAIGGHKALAAAKPYLERALSGSEIQLLDMLWYGGEASFENAQMIAESESYRNMTSDRPINDVSDLKGVKLRMNSNQVWNDVWNGLGATCVSIALNELYTSMQTGVANASEIPWADAASLKLEEVQDYIIQTQHVNEASVIYMSNSLYESLPAQYQEVLDRAAKEANEWGTELAMSTEDDYKQTFLDAGAELIVPDHDSFVEAARPIWDELFETTWTITTYDEVVALMEG